MADLINNPTCATGGGRTGIPSCAIDPKIIKGVILTDPSKVYDNTDLLDLVTALKTDTIASGADRIHPIFEFVEMKDSSEELTVATMGYGNKVPVKDGNYDWTFRFEKGGLCLLANFRQFNGLYKRVLFVDDEGNIYGTKTADGYLQGFSIDFVWGEKFKLTDASKPNEYWFRIAQADPKEWDNYAIWFNTANVNIPDEVRGLTEIELESIGTLLAGVVTVKVKEACTKINLYDTYDDELDDAALWVVTKAGVDVVISTVTKDVANKSFDVAFTGTGVHVITLETPALLAAAGVGESGNGYEAGTLTLTMPATS